MADSTNEGEIVAEEDRLPWLEAVDDEDDDQGIAPAKLIGGVIAALAVVGLVVGGAMWVRDRNAPTPADGAPVTVAAASGPYKVKPAEPGGMQVPGQGDTSYAASQGADPNSSIDLSAVPETPVVGTKSATAKPPAEPAKAKPEAKIETAKAAPPKPAPAPAKPPVQVATAKPAPAKPAAAVAGGTIQLGSFSSKAKADAAWTTLSKRFGFLSGMSNNVVTATVKSATVYRLQAAAGAQANNVCGKLKVAGENCMIVKS